MSDLLTTEDPQCIALGIDTTDTAMTNIVIICDITLP